MHHARRQWRREKRAAMLYRAVSDLESGTPRQLLFLELAKDADSEAMHWALELRKAGLPAPDGYRPGLAVRLTLRLLSWFGAASLRWLLSAWGLNAMRVFGASAQAAGQGLNGNESMQPAGRTAPLLRVDGLYAVHDAVLAQVALLLLMAGAGIRPGLMLFTGAAALLVGALAMAVGTVLSGHRLPIDGDALLPDLRELAAVYAGRGMSPEDARREAQRVLVDLELLDPQQPVSLRRSETVSGGWQSALVAFFSFAAGAALPLLPYLFEVQRHPLMMGCSLALVALFLCGWLLAEMAGRIALWGGLRSAALGWAGGALSYLAGASVAGWL